MLATLSPEHSILSLKHNEGEGGHNQTLSIKPWWYDVVSTYLLKSLPSTSSTQLSVYELMNLAQYTIWPIWIAVIPV